MRTTLLLALALTLLTACGNGTQVTTEANDTAPAKSTTAAATASAPVIKGGIVIQKITDYSPAFVSNLQNAAKDISIEKLDGPKLITEDGQTHLFPSVPAVGSRHTFKGGNDVRKVELVVERVNYSTIRYSLLIDQTIDGTYEEKALAELTPLFFLGDESDTDPATGISYLASEYSQPASECNNRIRIGQTDSGELRAKLVMDCDGLMMRMEEAPVLSVQKIGLSNKY